MDSLHVGEKAQEETRERNPEGRRDEIARITRFFVLCFSRAALYAQLPFGYRYFRPFPNILHHHEPGYVQDNDLSSLARTSRPRHILAGVGDTRIYCNSYRQRIVPSGVPPPTVYYDDPASCEDGGG
ncbi:unnamed protein product [Lasius platythorax]|uniref:Uncharacterized protein n=1 Tax=Lasius platythorax TaxID=488582 RepID=A0AAV2NV06_9HYME